MDRVRIFACAGTGMALSALGWFVSDAQSAFSNVSTDMLSRSTGVAMLGVSLVAAGLVFRAAMLAEQKPQTPETKLQKSEYHRGFGDRVVRAQAQLRQPTQRGVVVSLRRAVAEQGTEIISPADMGTVLPASEIERLQELLHNRAAQLVARNADVAKRRFMRSGVDLHNLAPQ
jgi:hypothetical protein